MRLLELEDRHRNDTGLHDDNSTSAITNCTVCSLLVSPTDWAVSMPAQLPRDGAKAPSGDGSWPTSRGRRLVGREMCGGIGEKRIRIYNKAEQQRIRQ
ncbi:unnamed protein product [Protopolystoma xenopodis]|uniref:Uncharacterized protein n=1 Tax=Protopolystoma xenopodis TaxID=117903 RepID=A0A3S5AV54_9PLAT|nr:unnamed protein product [Protopolystoma xenopodis]